MGFKLTEKDLAHLSDVIQQVEASTSGELRLILAKRSSQVGHVQFVLGLLLALIFVLGMWAAETLWWHSEHAWAWPLGLAVTFALAIWLARLNWVQRCLTTPNDRAVQAFMRCELEFHRAGMGATEGKTGILIFLSLMEHQAVVLADKGIAGRLPQDTWQGVISTALAGAKSGKWNESLEAALRECGSLLQKHFPKQAGDRDELSNHVIVLD